MLEHLTSNPILSALALTLFHFMWQGVLIAGVLKLMLVIVSKQKSLIRYSLSCLAMSANLVVPLITFFWCYQLYSLDSNSINSAYAITPTALLSEGVSSGVNLTWYTKLTPYLPYVSITWFVCVACLTLKLLLELHSVTRLPYQQSIPASKELQAKFSSLVKQLELKQSPKLIVSLKVDIPMAIGWLKPVVLLPANMLGGLSPTQLEMLLLHELAHIRRHDYIVNFLQTLVEILLFFHPAVMWVSKQMRQEREYCSDDIAVAHCGNAVAYAHTLADTASLCKKHRHATIPTMAMAASGGDLKQRVIRLVDHQCSNNNDAGRWFAGAILGLSLVLMMSKQFLSIPQLNVAVGELSLFNFYNKAAKSAFNEESSHKPEPLVETTIAKQLIAKQYNEQKIVVSPNSFLQTKADVHVPKLVKLETATIFEKRQEQLSEVVQTINTAEGSEQKIPLELAPQQSVVAQKLNVKTADQQSFTSTVSKDLTKATASDTSFETNFAVENSAKTDNPYAHDIAELAAGLDEPKANIALKATKKDTIFEKETDSSISFTASDNNELLTKPFEIRLNKTQKSPVNLPVKYSAELISASEPRYPSIAKRKGIELDVLVNFTIGKDGRIRNIEFKHQNKISYFKSAIISAMNKWTFLPAQMDGQPVESQMSKIFSFNLS
ncbi:M56 family metallopeptidase [Thalassotalea atypica]|uniref:M56 family metallopeptidase n=1 Tax=Thalassotalea atypica TaxID=2054316 RepID=UPI002573BAB8|nr:TonB family protein [Thalassotalea atypica]